MPFAIKERTKSKFVKPNWLTLTPGSHVVRFLETTDQAFFEETHFLVLPTGKLTIACLGEECPICQSNRTIYLADTKNFRNNKGYFSKSDRYTLNVLDRTMVKICPSCGEENKRQGNSYTPTCSSCQTLIASVAEAPSNKVKLLQLSRTAAEQLNSIETTMVDKDRNPIPLTAYDIVFSVSMTNGKKVSTPIPATQNNDVIAIPKEQLLDKNVTIRLTVAEVRDLLKGISLKDIFTARKSESTQTLVDSTVPTEDTTRQVVADDIAKKIAELYGNN
jgi:ribosomal protein L37AE/L43A